MHMIFLDTETTGLDPDVHEVWEIAYARIDGDVHTATVPHFGFTADPQALAMNGYHDNAIPSAPPDFDAEVIRELSGNILVCANPPFDRAFLRRRWGFEPWHYRSIDVESMAYSVLHYEQPKGMKDIAEDLRGLGYQIAQPGHRAWSDVVALRDCYKALRVEINKNRIY
jgi:DNA polymerase III epsilon subunit-like protein